MLHAAFNVTDSPSASSVSAVHVSTLSVYAGLGVIVALEATGGVLPTNKMVLTGVPTRGNPGEHHLVGGQYTTGRLQRDDYAQPGVHRQRTHVHRGYRRRGW